MDTESRTRHRTRRAILSAAASVLAHNRAATLPEIAEAAGVGRTTVHRYFPDRDTLIAAAITDSVDAIDNAVIEARIDRDPPREAMRRLVTAYLHVGDRLVFLFGDPNLAPQPREVAPDPVLDLITRGQRDNSFDPTLSPQWIRHVLWALVYTGIEESAAGSLSRHGVADTVIRTLERGIQP